MDAPDFQGRPPKVSPAARQPGIIVDRVSMTFSGGSRTVHALDNVSFEVQQGSFTSLIGQSGCGKSTLLSMMAGFIQPTAGKLSMSGESVVSRTLKRAMVFQEYALFPWRTAIRNVAFGLESRGLRHGAQAKALEYLELVGLQEFAHSYPHELSGGMQQRVAIARALAYEPDYLLMDEPLGAVDALTREQLQVLIARLWQSFNQTVVYVTHSVPEAVYLADQIIVMRPRPGRVRKIVNVDLPRPRNTSDPSFVSLVNEVTREITGEDTGPTPPAGGSGTAEGSVQQH